MRGTESSRPTAFDIRQLTGGDCPRTTVFYHYKKFWYSGVPVRKLERRGIMPYCPYCGVEVDDETRNCPLCTTEIPAGNPPPLLKDYYPHSEHQLHYTRRPFTAEERRSVFWFFSLLFSVPLTIVIVVDLLRDWAITWSLFPIAGILAVWAGIAIGL